MAPHQLQLDFAISEIACGERATQSATVVELDRIRSARQKADLGSLHQGICESVKHIRLSRSTSTGLDTPPKR